RLRRVLPQDGPPPAASRQGPPVHERPPRPLTPPGFRISAVFARCKVGSWGPVIRLGAHLSLASVTRRHRSVTGGGRAGFTVDPAPGAWRLALGTPDDRGRAGRALDATPRQVAPVVDQPRRTAASGGHRRLRLGHPRLRARGRRRPPAGRFHLPAGGL